MAFRLNLQLLYVINKYQTLSDIYKLSKIYNFYTNIFEHRVNELLTIKKNIYKIGPTTKRDRKYHGIFPYMPSKLKKIIKSAIQVNDYITLEVLLGIDDNLRNYQNLKVYDKNVDIRYTLILINTSLEIATELNKYKMIKILIYHGANSFNNCLKIACINNNIKLIKKYLHYGANNFTECIDYMMGFNCWLDL